MLRYDSLSTKTWVTNDGRHLAIEELSDAHLHAIRAWLQRRLPPGYDQEEGCRTARHFMSVDAGGDVPPELELEAFSAAWIQLINEELARRGLAAVDADTAAPRVGLCVLVLKEGKILLGKRKGSHGEGEYAPPGGHLEYLEGFHACAVREVQEETGLEIKLPRFLLVRNSTQYAPHHYIEFAFVAAWSAGVPEVREPDKVESWSWYSPQDLPSPLFALTAAAIEALFDENAVPTCEDILSTNYPIEQKKQGDKAARMATAKCEMFEEGLIGELLGALWPDPKIEDESSARAERNGNAWIVLKKALAEVEEEALGGSNNGISNLRSLYQDANSALHCLWTAEVGKDGYDKKAWMALDSAFQRCARIAALKYHRELSDLRM